MFIWRKNSSHTSVYSVTLCRAVIHCATLFYTRKSCLCALYAHMSICITFLILMYPYTELLLFLYIVLNSPNVPHLSASSLKLVRTVLKKLYIIAFQGFSCPTHVETTCCVPYLWQTCTFHIHTQVLDTLFLYLFTLWITFLFTLHLRVVVLKQILL